MKTLERRYSKSERIIAKAKFSASVYFKNLLFALILGGIVAVLWIFNDQIEHLITKSEGEVKYLTDAIMRWVLLGAGIAVLISLIVQALSLYAKELIVTEDKVVYRTGIIAVKNTTIPISEIVIIESKQNLFQRIANTGTLYIVSDALQPYKIRGVKAADRLTRRIMKQVAIVKRENESRTVQLQLAGYAKKQK